LISQKNHRGCTVPIYFNIVTSKQKLEEGIIEQLMYYQCFNYANWTGSIKIPAILQYAKKFARFSSEVLGDSNIKDESLCKKPYFI
jgi:aubergine-like protein